MTIAPDRLDELDFPTPDPLLEAQREIYDLMFQPGKSLALIETETFEQRMLRERQERLDRQEADRVWRRHMRELDEMLRQRTFSHDICYCSPGRSMMFDAYQYGGRRRDVYLYFGEPIPTEPASPEPAAYVPPVPHIVSDVECSELRSNRYRNFVYATIATIVGTTGLGEIISALHPC